VVTTWRSGSTFFGELLTQFPANFYFFEPLWPFGVKQFQDPAETEPVDFLKKLLKCNFTGLEDYIELRKTGRYCESEHQFADFGCKKNKFCYRPECFEQFCKLFPLQTMKLCGMRLNVAAALLRDLR
jgi:hypothetical protein